MMNILFCCPTKDMGSGWHRCYLPAKCIQEATDCDVFVTDVVTPELASWADIFIWQRPWMPESYKLVQFLKHHYPEKKHIADYDDDLFSIPKSYSKQMPIEAQNGVKGFAKIMDAVTVSTFPLATIFKRLNKNVFVFPNALDLEGIVTPQLKAKDEIRIGWCGSASHYDDLKYILKPLVEISKKYSHAKFVFMGFLPDYLKDNIPQDRLEYHDWVDIDKYYDKLKSLNLDIGLAPLDYFKFNESKSNLKWLEYSCAGVPVIASNVLPYVNTIEDGFDGFIVKNNKCENWIETILELIDSAEYGLYIAKNAQDKLMQDYDMYKNVNKLVNFYERIINGSR